MCQQQGAGVEAIRKNQQAQKQLCFHGKISPFAPDFGAFGRADTWKQDRDALVHNLANIPYNDNAVREAAERGKKLIDTLSNRVKSVNNYYKKLYAEQEKVND